MTDWEEKKRRADEAAFILGSSVFQQSFEALDARYVNSWRKAQDIRSRERVWQMQKALSAVRDEMLDVLNSYQTLTGGLHHE
jgi:hypothetical protein